MRKISKISFGILLIAVLLSGCGDGIGDKYVGFAECLNQKGVKLYGAYWCSHCANQKAHFGKQAIPKLPYIECDPRGKNPQIKLCLDKGMRERGYPTWEFQDGSFVSGEMELAEISAESGCALP